MNNDLKTLPPPPTGQKGITFEELNSLPPPPKGQTGFTLSQIKEQTQPKASILNPNDPLRNFGIGAVKGATETLQNIGNVVAKPLGKLFGVKQEEIGFKPEQLQAQNQAQEIGKMAERAAEFLVPAGKIAKFENSIDLLVKGKNFLSAGTRILAKSGIEGLSTGAIRTAQTGDVKEGLKAGTTASIFRGGLATIGEGSRALRLPERLYSTIFKNTYNDVVSDLKTSAISELKQNNPTRFNELVEKGIIKIGKNSEVIVNETLAKEALDRGLRGSVNGMAKTVINNTLDLEDQARTLAKESKSLIDFTEPQFKNVLNKVKTDFADVGLGEMSDEADSFIKALDKGAGKLNAEDTLKFKRFLDSMRIKSSFQALQPSQLSQTQQNFRTLANLARTRLKEAVPGMAKTMDDYGFNIDALDALAKEAKRRGNNQIISLIDSVFLGGGVASQAALPTAILLGIRRFMNSPRGVTALAQSMNNPATKPLGEFIRALTGYGVSEATDDL